MGEDIDADFVSTTFAAAAGYSSMIAGARPGTILNLFERTVPKRVPVAPLVIVNQYLCLRPVKHFKYGASFGRIAVGSNLRPTCSDLRRESLNWDGVVAHMDSARGPTQDFLPQTLRGADRKPAIRVKVLTV